MPSSSFVLFKAKDIVQLQPFQGQRDIDGSRVPVIREQFQKSIADTNTVYFDAPFILVEGASIDVVLSNKSNEKVFRAICDGQHRAEALKGILQQHPELENLNVPVFVHRVKSIEEAHTIQRNLFKQKPVDLYDKAEKHPTSNLMHVLKGFQSELAQEYPRVSTLFKQGRYGDPNLSPQRMHLMTDELVFSIKNSPNINQWIRADITPKTFTKGFITIVQQCVSRFFTQKMKHLTAQHLQTLHGKHGKYGDILYLSYYYYKQYPLLVSELETTLGLVDECDE